MYNTKDTLIFNAPQSAPEQNPPAGRVGLFAGTNNALSTVDSDGNVSVVSPNYNSTKVVSPSGGDYTTVAEAIAGEGAASTSIFLLLVGDVVETGAISSALTQFFVYITFEVGASWTLGGDLTLSGTNSSLRLRGNEFASASNPGSFGSVHFLLLGHDVTTAGVLEMHDITFDTDLKATSTITANSLLVENCNEHATGTIAMVIGAISVYRSNLQGCEFDLDGLNNTFIKFGHNYFIKALTHPTGITSLTNTKYNDFGALTNVTLGSGTNMLLGVPIP